MRIRITPKNAAKLESALQTVNGKATAWTITSARDLELYAKDSEERLAGAGIPKGKRAGAVAFHTPGGPSANRYKYNVRTTSIRLERGATGWFLVGVFESTQYPKAPAYFGMTITEEQRDIVVEKALQPFSVAAPLRAVA